MGNQEAKPTALSGTEGSSPKGSLGNKFTYSEAMISMSCWLDTNALGLYPIERKVEKLIVFSN